MSDCIKSFDCANGDHSDACGVQQLWYTPESAERLLLRHCKCHLVYEREFIAEHLNAAFAKGMQIGSGNAEKERQETFLKFTEAAMLRGVAEEQRDVANAQLNLAIGALKTCWKEYWWMDEEHRGVTVEAFCDMRGITRKQFDLWGIDQ